MPEADAREHALSLTNRVIRSATTLIEQCNTSGPEYYQEFLNTRLSGLKEAFRSGISSADRDGLLENYLVLALLIGHKELGYRPKESQIQAAITMIGGKFVEQPLGDGKTFSLALTAGWHALQGKRIQIHTDKAANAQVGADSMAPFFTRLGIPMAVTDSFDNVRVVMKDGTLRKVPPAYFSAFVETARDQPLRQPEVLYTEYTVPIHNKLRNDFNNSGSRAHEDPSLITLVDEFDLMFLASPCSLSGEPALEENEWLKRKRQLKIIWRAVSPSADRLKTIEEAYASCGTSDDGELRQATDENHGDFAVYGTEVIIGSSIFNRVALSICFDPEVTALLKDIGAIDDETSVSSIDESHFYAILNWLTDNQAVLHAAMTARYGMQKDRDYHTITRDGQTDVELIGAYSGQALPHQQLIGLTHQFLYLKEGLEPPEPRLTVNSIHPLTYYCLQNRRHPGSVVGISGTLLDYSDVVQELFGTSVVPIESTEKAQVAKKAVVFTSQERKLDYIIQQIAQAYKRGKPVLLYERQPQAIRIIREGLEKAGVKPEDLTEISAKTEDNSPVVLLAVGKNLPQVSSEKSGVPVILDSLDPRGFNLPIANGLIILSGLNPVSPCFDRQVMGRLGGSRGLGEALYVIGPEDAILQTPDSPLARQILRHLKTATSDLLPEQKANQIIGMLNRLQNANFNRQIQHVGLMLLQDAVLQDLRDELVKQLGGKVPPDVFRRFWANVLIRADELLIHTIHNSSYVNNSAIQREVWAGRFWIACVEWIWEIIEHLPDHERSLFSDLKTLSLN